MENMSHTSELPKPEIMIDFSKFTPTQFYDFMTEVRQSLYKLQREDIWVSVASRLHDAVDSSDAQKILIQYVKLL